MTAFMTPEILPRFGLPETLSQRPTRNRNPRSH
jgi:hypothetical protein